MADFGRDESPFVRCDRIHLRVAFCSDLRSAAKALTVS